MITVYYKHVYAQYKNLMCLIFLMYVVLGFMCIVVYVTY